MIHNIKMNLIGGVIFLGCSAVCNTLVAAEAPNIKPSIQESDATPYTNTQSMPVGNTTTAPQPGNNPNPESPAIYPQNQDYIQTQSPSKDGNSSTNN